MAVDLSAEEAFALQAERFYASLCVSADAGVASETGLGGRLFYAGELNAEARALIVAANISGAATLTASADAEARKQAMRDGVVDFLVTTLDEALRILKNEIRKRETVAVCVGEAPETVEREMHERGVLPDLMRPIEIVPLQENQAVIICRVTSSPALWLPKIDVIFNESLEKNSNDGDLDSETWESMRRWLRLAPRYLGRLAQGVRVLRCNEETAARILEDVRMEVAEGRIGSSVELKALREGSTEIHLYTPRVN